MSLLRVGDSEFRYEHHDRELDEVTDGVESAVADFTKTGCALVRELLRDDEVSRLRQAVDSWPAFQAAKFALADTDGATYDQTQWIEPGTDMLGAAAGCAKTVGLAQQLLNQGELYMYSGKVIMKQPHTGGALLWHQDYGYWYKNRAPYPHFVTCILALTKSDRENGGVKLVSGSHHCGRIEHSLAAGQTGADLDRVAMLTDVFKLPVVQADLRPGDALFFHANTLHASEANVSQHRRWNLIFSYNAACNSPDVSHYNAIYGEHELRRYPTTALMSSRFDGVKLDDRHFLQPQTNPNIRLGSAK